MIIIHLGFHKTGTSWLQDRLFPKLDVNFINKRSVKTHTDFPMIQVNSEVLVRKYLKAVKTLDSDGINLFSNENLSKVIMDKLPKLLYDILGPDIKVIFSIRKQDDLMFSRWQHWDKFLDHKELDNVFSRKDADKLDRLIGYYDYNSLYKEMTDVFGGDMVHFIVFCNMFKNPQDELKRLVDFIGIPTPKINIKTLASRPVAKSNFKVDKSKYKRVLKDILIRFSQSNKKFDNKIDVDLKGLGYYEN